MDAGNRQRGQRFVHCGALLSPLPRLTVSFVVLSVGWHPRLYAVAASRLHEAKVALIMVEPAFQGGVTTYVYTAIGQLASIMDAAGEVTSYGYKSMHSGDAQSYPLPPVHSTGISRNCVVDGESSASFPRERGTTNGGIRRGPITIGHGPRWRYFEARTPSANAHTKLEICA